MKRSLIRLGLAALVSTALYGCGGGGDGINGTNTVAVPVGSSTPASTVASNATSPSSASVQAWRALQPTVSVTGVTINSPPVVTFSVTDANGAAVTGLANWSHASTARGEDLTANPPLSAVNSLTNVSFTLAKLVPATATSPSRWVSYLVTKPTTEELYRNTASTNTKNKESCTADRLWCGTYPTTDKEGKLEETSPGNYKYTFFRDIKLVKGIVDSFSPTNTPVGVSADGLKKKADLDDLTFDPSATHRLGIVISGAAPGTGSNTPSAVTVTPSVNIAIAANKTFDFRPDGGNVAATRNVVDIDSCSSCHNGKGLAHGGSRKDPNLCVTCHTDQVKYGMSVEATRSAALQLNGTTQNTTSVLDGRAIGTFPNLTHKIHMGNELKLAGYNYNPNSTTLIGKQFEKGEWIQDPRDCTKCHNGSYDPTTTATTATMAAATADKANIAKITKDGDNWKAKPSRLACGACHDNVDFATGVITTSTGTSQHGGTATPVGPALDDGSCSSCHTPAVIAESHRTEAPTANNPIQIAGVVNFDYVIKSVTVEKATGKTTFKFQILMDGSPVLSMPTTGAAYTANSSQAIAGFNSGPTFYVAFAVAQDGVATPADFNAYLSSSLANLIDGTKGTLTAPTDSAGVWTAQFTAASMLVPTATTYPLNPATMVTGAMIGNFTQVDFNATKTAGLIDTTTDLGKKWNQIPAGSTTYLNGSTTTKGLYAKTPLQKATASLCTTPTTCTAYSARRIAVETAKCQSCHEQLGAAVEFHSGARNDATSCAICHNPNRTSSAWSANASTFIHGIHAGTSKTTVDLIAVGVSGTNSTADVGVPGTGSGGAGLAFSTGKRTIPFSWHRAGTATVPTWNAAAIAYPGILKNCDNCHVPNAVNFGTNGANLLPNLLWSTSTTGTINYATDATKSLPRDPVTGASPHANLNSTASTAYGSAFSFSATTGVSTPAAATTLVESPVSAACFACHDSSTARLHITQYGGTIYGTRTAAYSSNTATTYGGRALQNNETCLICHGYGRAQDAAVVHAK